MAIRNRKLIISDYRAIFCRSPRSGVGKAQSRPEKTGRVRGHAGHTSASVVEGRLAPNKSAKKNLSPRTSGRSQRRMSESSGY